MTPVMYNKRQYYPQFVVMRDSDCGRAFFEAVDVDRPGDPRTNLAIINYYLHLNFEYRPDGIADVWCVPGGDLATHWADDCDGFAFRAAVELAKSGIPKGDIFIATVLTYLQRVRNIGTDPYHPQWVEADHMVTLVVIGGVWYVVDSAQPETRKLHEAFGTTGYRPRGIISFGNYGPGKDNDAERGFRRWWVRT